jgi:hypothetical protein
MRATCLVVLGLAAIAVPARAGEPADRGFSMTAWAGAAVDRSVSAVETGRSLHDGAPLLGATAIGNVRAFAIGGAVDGTPGINGDGRLSIAALLGFQPEVRRLRIQVLGETVPAHGMFEVGGWLFGRADIGRATVTSVGTFIDETRTDYRLGGWMCGIGLEIGLRLEAADPRRTEELMMGAR